MGRRGWQIDAIDITIPSIYHCPSPATRVTRSMGMPAQSTGRDSFCQWVSVAEQGTQAFEFVVCPEVLSVT